MGALEYQPASGPEVRDDPLEVERLVALANDVLAERSSLRADLAGDPDAMNTILQTECIDKYEASVWRVPDPLGTNKSLVKKTSTP